MLKKEIIVKKVVIIGAAGFVGHYLIDHLYEQYGWSIVATKMKSEQLEKEGIKVSNLDILEFEEVKKLFHEERPDYIIHLAAQSSVALSWKNPQLTVDINIKGTCNVLEAIRTLDYKPRILLIGSGEEYGMFNGQSSQTVDRPGVLVREPQRTPSRTE